MHPVQRDHSCGVRSDKDRSRDRLLCSQSAELRLPNKGEDLGKEQAIRHINENEVEYAHKLDKDLSVVGKDFTDFTYDPIFTSNAFTQMKITEDVGEGKIHIGVLQASSDLVGTLPLTSLSTAPVINNGKPGTAWYKPALEIDEDYWGTYHVEKNMTLSVPYSRNKPTYDWLPCSCMTTPGGIGGWNDMFPTDQKAHSAKGFFDCTTCWPSKPCSS